jgi:hypothetical protein
MTSIMMVSPGFLCCPVFNEAIEYHSIDSTGYPNGLGKVPFTFILIIVMDINILKHENLS